MICGSGSAVIAAHGGQSGDGRGVKGMGQLTANKARLYDNIEAGLHLVAPLIDRLENHYGCDDGLYLARATLGKAFASLELLRAEMVER